MKLGGALVATALLLVACGGGDDDAGSNGTDSSDLPDCPVGALDDAAGPVEITFWHTMARANETALTQLTEAYNASQSKVKVTLVNNTSYDDQQAKYRAGLTTGDLPDVVMHQDIYLQQLVDTQTVLPAQSCIDETDDFAADDFVPRTLEYYSLDHVQWGLPFNLSNPVLYYDRAAFTKAGLDPDQPPNTFDGLREAAEKIKAAGYPTGMSLKVDSWHFEQLIAQQDQAFVDQDNGRDGRAEASVFDSDAGNEVFEFYGGMVADGLATPNPRSGPDQFNNLLGIGGKQHAMTFESSAALGTITELLSGGQYADVELGVAPLPGRTADGGLVVGGAALYISATDAAKQAASWDYMTYLTSPESQATWAAATGYIPVRTSATELPALTQRWTELPAFKVAYDQLVDSASSSATAGAVIGDYETVRAAVEDAQDKMFLNNGSPADALSTAGSEATAAIESYNDRL